MNRCIFRHILLLLWFEIFLKLFDRLILKLILVGLLYFLLFDPIVIGIVLICQSIDFLQRKLSTHFKILQSYNYPKQNMEQETQSLKIQPLTNQTRYTLKPIKVPTSQRQRVQTEPSELSVSSSLNRQSIRRSNKFTQQYLSLVDKLRINLSKDYFQKRRSRQFIREKDHLYKDQNNTSFRQFSLGRKQINKNISKPKPLMVSLRNNKKENVSEDKYVHQQKQSQISQRVLQLSRIKLINGKKNDNKTGNLSFEKLGHLDEHDFKRNQTQHSIKYSKKQSAAQKQLQMLQNRKKKLLPHKHQILQIVNQDELILNLEYQKYNQLCFHIQILLDIYSTLFIFDGDTKQQQILLKLLKNYVLGSRKVEENVVILDDICRLDSIYKEKQKQKDLKSLIFMERILVILTIDLISSSKINKYLHQVKQLFESVLGIYLYFVYALSQNQKKNNSSFLVYIRERLTQFNIHIKKEVASLTIFFYKKLTLIMKANNELHQQFKILLTQLQNRNVTINRGFYQLLKLYAIYLNHHESILDKNPQIKTFATCPSPYLTKPVSKLYTLVFDLDETLVHVREQYSKIQIFIRPFAKELMNLMSQNFQIVIFTSSMPSHSQHIIDSLPGISFKLYRYHTTRVKGRMLKDLNRLGRPLEKTIIIDNDEQCFMLHKQNGIKVSEWRGGDPSDQELNIIGLFLSNLVKDAPEDVREYLDSYSAFRKKYY